MSRRHSRSHPAGGGASGWWSLPDPENDPCGVCGETSGCYHCSYCHADTETEFHLPECPWETGLWPIVRSHQGTACARCGVSFEPSDSYVIVLASVSSRQLAVCLGCGAHAFCSPS